MPLSTAIRSRVARLARQGSSPSTERRDPPRRAEAGSRGQLLQAHDGNDGQVWNGTVGVVLSGTASGAVEVERAARVGCCDPGKVKSAGR